MGTSCVVGLDVGTSSVKVVTVDRDGRVLTSASHAYQASYTQDGGVEQHPDAWLEGLHIAMSKALAGIVNCSVESIGFTGQMHGSVMLDGHGEVVRPALLWNDQRTASQAKRMERDLGAERVIELTGNQIVIGFTASKILWVREREPDLFQRIRHVMLPKDYLSYRFTGELATDVHDASGTLLFDVRSRRWSDEMIRYVGLHPQYVPPVAECTDVVGHLEKTMAQSLGLAEGIPVVAGAGDQATAAIGMGVIDERECNLSLGTSGVVFSPTTLFREENKVRLHQFCYVRPDMWSLMGVMLSAGGGYEWWRTILPDPADSVQKQNLADSQALPLLFLPYLLGERTPHLDAQARGAFIGLHRTHGRAEMEKAILEGISFGLRDIYELLLLGGMQPKRFTVTGGGAANEAWMRILSSVFHQPLVQIQNQEGSAYGAAILAAVGAGWSQDAVEMARIWSRPVERKWHPDPDLERRYDRLYTSYQKAYPALYELFHELACS